MALFWKAGAGVLVTVILCLILGRQERDLALMLSMAAAAMVGLLFAEYLEPVVEFMEELKQRGQLNGDMVAILLRAAGIGIVTEITANVCKDGGSGALGEGMKMLGSGVILWLSLPLFTALLNLMQRILGGI